MIILFKNFGIKIRVFQRNYGYKWLTGGSSTNKCSDTYAGSSANSELETKAVQSAINAHLGEWYYLFKELLY